MKKWMFKVVFVSWCMTFAALAFAQTTATATNSNSNSADSSVVTVAVSEYPPYVYATSKDVNAKIEGIIPQVLNMISKVSGLQFQVKMYPTWEDAHSAAIYGETKAIIDHKTKTREEYLVYTHMPIFYLRTALFAKKDFNIKFTGDLRQLNKYRIGMLKLDDYYGDDIEKAVDQHRIGEVFYSDSLKDLNQQLMDGKIDIIISRYFEELEELKNANLLDKVKVLHPEVDRVPIYMIFSLKSNDTDELVDKVDDAVRELNENGSYDKLVQELMQQYTKVLNLDEE